jgi:pSer/pThr/pTyr-binding forkhead associated (FHA) protein
MSVRLLVKQRSQEGGSEKSTEVILDEEAILLGRDKTCQVVLAEQAVSRSHARISSDGALCFLEDLGSAYGTLINGKQLPRGEKRLLRNGDVIGIAQFDLTFDRIAEAPKNGRGEGTAMVARQVVKDVMRGLGKGEGPFFRIMNGPNEGQRVEIPDAAEIVFGRDETADVMLKDDLVSRRHAKVRRDWSGTHVEDLESRNGIRVNKKRIVRKTLHDRDELEVGGVRLLYLDPAEVRESPVVLPGGADPEEEGAEATTAQDPEEQAAEEAAAQAAAEADLAPDPDPGLEAGSDDGPPVPDDNRGDEFPPEDDSGEPAPSGPLATLRGLFSERDPKVLVPVISMVVFAIVALVVTILVLVGA